MHSFLNKKTTHSALIALLLSLLICPALEVRINSLYVIFSLTLFGTIISQSRLNFIFIWAAWIAALSYTLICTSPLIKYTAPMFINIDPLPEKADAVVVLSAESPLRNRIKSQGLERLIHGIKLIKEGHATTLVLTDQPWFRGNPSQDRTLILGELEKNSISVGPVENTFDEAKSIKQLVEQRGWSNIILVTSPLHSSRAKAIFREQIPKVTIISSPAEAREFDIDLLNSSYDKLKAARLMFYELAAWCKNIILGRL